MRFRLLVFAFLFAGSFLPLVLSQVDFPLGPDSRMQPGVPAGELIGLTMEHSSYYPGTVRPLWVYLPAGFDREASYPVMVFSDGHNFRSRESHWYAPIVLDNLIHKGEIPSMIAVFVKWGEVPALEPETAFDRMNRSFEYDSVGDRYARFLDGEVFPLVERELGVQLTDDPNLRGIAGSSSSGIAAVNAAFMRPDLFRRAYSGVGTFVGFRGGQNLATYARKMEPKPIRVFLQGARNDLDNHAGNWWISNQNMLSAFQYHNYAVNFEWGEGGHNPIHSGFIFPKAMRWLWAEWEQPILPGSIQEKSRLANILRDGSPWYVLSGERAEWEERSNREVSWRAGAWLISDKHLLYTPEGDETRAVAEWNSELAAVALSPDHSILAVVFAHSRFGWAYQPQADGSLSFGQPFYHMHIPEDADSNRAGGAVFDALGQLYVATRIGIQVFGHQGRCDAILELPDQKWVQHLSFGGPDGRTLLAQVADGTVYGREMKVRGGSTTGTPRKSPVFLR